MAKGLGRGLDAFFGEDNEETIEKVTKRNSKKEKETENVVDKVIELNITEVEPMLNQPRKVFDKEKMQELTDSIKENGVIQPILVVKDANGYTIVAGERRWRAAKAAGLETIPAIIKEKTMLVSKVLIPAISVKPPLVALAVIWILLKFGTPKNAPQWLNIAPTK